MNEQAELARLKEQQVRLEQDLSRMAAEIKRLDQVLNAPAPAPVSAIPPPLPPVIPKVEMVVSSPVDALEAPPANNQIPVVEPALQAATTSTPVSEPSRLRLRVEPGRAPGSSSGHLPEPAAPVLPAASKSTPPAAPSLEMRVGTFWLVRIGIVMVLTGLVFFGRLAYENYISRLGPGGKIFLLYLASGLLLGAGWWWQRKAAKDSLKNYAQVLFGGGLAALYFTTYAAHHIEPLRIIQSALTDGILLLGCAGFMVWIADRKKSEVLALFAVGLAYYTSIITRVGYFTLYSNLVLTIAGVWFLVRNRWAMLSFGSLIASYAAYGFWRFFDGTNWHWASPAEGLWSGTYFLISYWLLFTAAVFLSRHERLAGENRAGFLTLNNGAFFTLFLLTMLQVQEGSFWKFALIYGSVLLALAAAAARVLQAEPLAKNSYLTQGLLLVTVGFISKFAGLQLALILAAESVVLLAMGQRRKSRVLLAGAYLAAFLAVFWGIDGMREEEASGIWLAIGLGALMMVNTLLVHRSSASAQATRVRLEPAYFTVLALSVWLVATWDNVSHEHFPLVICFEGLVLTLSIYVLKVREISLFSQSYLVLGQLAWFYNSLNYNHPLPWWQPALLITISLFLGHWWQRQKMVALSSEGALGWQGVYGLAIIGLFYFWISPRVEAAPWLAIASLLSVGLTAYGALTRAWLLAACAQLFVLVSSLQFASQLWEAKPAWYFPVAPMAALGLLSWSTVQWFRSEPGSGAELRGPLLQLAQVYRWVALGMSIWWVCEYIPARERIWLLSLLGLWAFLWSGLKRNREALLFSASFTAVALILFWVPLVATPMVYWPNLLVMIVLLAQRQFARRLPDRYPQDPALHGTVIVIGGLSLWRFLSLWVGELEQARGGSYMTAGWSVLALVLFSVGIALRERMYRYLGLGILACALGRVVLFDVWKLETLYRVLSFMALGIVLLVLGFIYNRYQEKIKEWL